MKPRQTLNNYEINKHLKGFVPHHLTPRVPTQFSVVKHMSSPLRRNSK